MNLLSTPFADDRAEPPLRTAAGVEVDRFTVAPLLSVVETVLEAPRTQVFERLIRGAGLALFRPPTPWDLRLSDPCFGAPRTRRGRARSRDRWVHWDPPHGCAYQLWSSSIPIEGHLTVVALGPDPEGTRLRCYHFGRIPSGPRGWWVLVAVRRTSRRDQRALIELLGGRPSEITIPPGERIG